MPELSTKPYLIRAIHEWCADCGHTPYLAVVVDERTIVPRAYVKNGEIVLNVSMSATNRLSIGNELIEFQARFGGAAHELSIPVENVTAIYARETGHGMAFDVPKPPAVKEERRSSRPVAVASVPRPDATAPAPADAAADEPAPAALPAPLPVSAASAPAPSAPLQAVETDVAAPAAGGAPASTPAGPALEVAREDSDPGSSAPAADAPEAGTPGSGDAGPEDGGSRPRRGGRPRLTRVK